MNRTKRDVNISSEHGTLEELWLRDLWQSQWGGDVMISRGHAYLLHDLKWLFARLDGELAGAATYRPDGRNGIELMSLDATRKGLGIGTSLLRYLENNAAGNSIQRLWLITSNDNVDSLRFYQKRGYRFQSIYPGAIDEARKKKPSIPLFGDYGIEIHDEIELAKDLTS